MKFFNLFSILSILNYEAPTRQGYSAQAPKVPHANITSGVPGQKQRRPAHRFSHQQNSTDASGCVTDRFFPPDVLSANTVGSLLATPRANRGRVSPHYLPAICHPDRLAGLCMGLAAW